MDSVSTVSSVTKQATYVLQANNPKKDSNTVQMNKVLGGKSEQVYAKNFKKK